MRLNDRTSTDMPPSGGSDFFDFSTVPEGAAWTDTYSPTKALSGDPDERMAKPMRRNREAVTENSVNWEGGTDEVRTSSDEFDAKRARFRDF
jgi:hypothetical protein